MSRPPPRTVAPVPPRPAATTLIVRDGAAGLELLMVRRSLQASFMPGAYVFPGGAVDASDGDAAHAALLDEPAERLAQRIGAVLQLDTQALAFSVAGLRECFEECGLWLGAPEQHPGAANRGTADWARWRARLHAGTTLATLAHEAGLPLATSALRPWARWVTPVGLPKRFDTVFFVCRAPAGQTPEVDAGETTTLVWVHPLAALEAYDEGAFPMEFATVSTVRSLAPFAASSQALLAHADALCSLAPLHPRLRLDADGAICGVLMPGQTGYELAHAG